MLGGGAVCSRGGANATVMCVHVVEEFAGIKL